MKLRPHPKQVEFMRESPSRIVMAGVSRAWGWMRSKRHAATASWSADAFARDAELFCQRRVGYIRQAPEDATGFLGIDYHGTRPCGGRLNDGKCEFCDVTTIEEAR